MDGIVLAEELPSAAEYREFRAKAGWGDIDESIARQPSALPATRSRCAGKVN
jgi:hypothetical protein